MRSLIFNINAFIFAVGGFASAYYWSSTDFNIAGAWGQYFSDGVQFGRGKADAGYVRAVRSF